MARRRTLGLAARWPTSGSLLNLSILLALYACDHGGEELVDRVAPPRVVRLTYDNGTTAKLAIPVAGEPVPTGIALDVWFDRFLEPDSVTSSSIRLESNLKNVQVVRVAVSYDPLDRRVRLEPARALDPMNTYRLHVTSNIRSLAGMAAEDVMLPFATGAEAGGGPPEPAEITWALVEPQIRTTCESTRCHGDGVASPSCERPSATASALDLSLDDPIDILRTAVGVRAAQWPGWLRIEPGRPDRSYVVYKMVDVGEEHIVGNLMPNQGDRGAGASANGEGPPGFCCPPERLPRAYPPPFAEPGEIAFDFFRRRSGRDSDPFVYECACTDARGRFGPQPGRCKIAEDECADGRDDDEDGLTDCDDPNCRWAPSCAELECADGRDDDEDGLTDCDDPDCAAAEPCVGQAEVDCENGRDDDGDGLTDCRDPQCSSSGQCESGSRCSDGADNDFDDRIDCADTDCGFASSCNRGLESPRLESLSYCRARLVSDWILQGAPLGPTREHCEQICALRCESRQFDECRRQCQARPLLEEGVTCERDAICDAYGEQIPLLDIQAGGLIERPGDGEPDCRAFCSGTVAASCDDLSNGSPDRCTDSCDRACATLEELCTALSICS